MSIEPHPPHVPRVTGDGYAALEDRLTAIGVQIADRDAFAPALRETLDSYEALANGIGEWLLTPMPALAPATVMEDDWQVGA